MKHGVGRFPILLSAYEGVAWEAFNYCTCVHFGLSNGDFLGVLYLDDELGLRTDRKSVV